MAPTSFSINFDYRCPFARNANEHVIAALEGGAAYDVNFQSFSLGQVHVEDGGLSVWDDPDKARDNLANAAGIVVRDRFPDRFFDAHRSLFALRHDDGDDLRDEDKLRNALSRADVDPDAVFKEIADGWPLELSRVEHERSVADHAVFGVPTFISADQAVFVRLMTRPAGDHALAAATIDRVLELLAGHPEINEYKHTSIPR